MSVKKFTIESIDYQRLAFSSVHREDRGVNKHAYLVLLDCTKSHSNPKVLAELHCNNAEDPNGTLYMKMQSENTRNIIPNVREPIKRYLHAEGKETDIRAIWCEMLKAACEVSSLKVKFDPYGPNCQTGVRTILESVGLPFDPDDEHIHQIRGGHMSLFPNLNRDPVMPLDRHGDIDRYKGAAHLANALLIYKGSSLFTSSAEPS